MAGFKQIFFDSGADDEDDIEVVVDFTDADAPRSEGPHPTPSQPSSSAQSAPRPLDELSDEGTGAFSRKPSLHVDFDFTYWAGLVFTNVI